MDDDDALKRFLAGPALTAMQDYADNLGPAMLSNSLGSSIRVECSRTIDVDRKTVEIVVVDTIEFRISGPSGPHPGGGGGPDRRARTRRKRNGKIVRH
jgi:hypothetical protein